MQELKKAVCVTQTAFLIKKVTTLVTTIFLVIIKKRYNKNMKKMLFFCLAIVYGSLLFAQDNNWAKTAASDLDFMYQMYRDNHAAGIDPNNPAFNKKLEKYYKQAHKKAMKAIRSLIIKKRL